MMFTCEKDLKRIFNNENAFDSFILHTLYHRLDKIGQDNFRYPVALTSFKR